MDDLSRLMGALDNVSCVIWFCPDRHDENHVRRHLDDPRRATVEWARSDDGSTMTSTCLDCGRVGPAKEV